MTVLQSLGQYFRIFLLTLSGINLALGLIFYISPGTVISYWPWPVKELATRFLGAIFLAISLGCWSAIQAKVWQRAKILVLVGGAFLGLTGIVSIVRGHKVSSIATIWVWTVWAFLQKDPARIVVLLPLDAIFPSLALIAVGISWNIIVAESPSWMVTAVWLVLYSFVAVGSTLLYLTIRRGASVQ